MSLKKTFRSVVRSALIGKLILPSAPSVAVVALALFALISAQGMRILPAYADPDAATANGSVFTNQQKDAIGEIIRDYLIKYPEMIVEMQRTLDEKQKKEQSANLKSLVAEIANEANNAIAGDADGDVTVVEFFDYNCDFCKRGLPHVQQLIRNDKKLRFVFKDLAVLSKGSVDASRAALAAKRQGKYWEFHQAMLGSKGQANEASALKIAGSLGLDMDRLKIDMESDAVKKELDDVKVLADKIGIIGTPHFLVGDKSFTGSPENLHDRLEKYVSQFRMDG